MKSLKTMIMELLKEEIDPTMGVSEAPVSRQRAIALAIIEKAMKGDLPAVNFIRDLTENKETVRQSGEQIVRIKVME